MHECFGATENDYHYSLYNVQGCSERFLLQHHVCERKQELELDELDELHELDELDKQNGEGRQNVSTHEQGQWQGHE